VSSACSGSVEQQEIIIRDNVERLRGKQVKSRRRPRGHLKHGRILTNQAAATNTSQLSSGFPVPTQLMRLLRHQSFYQQHSVRLLISTRICQNLDATESGTLLSFENQCEEIKTIAEPLYLGNSQDQEAPPSNSPFDAVFFKSSKAFCRCRLFQFSVREMLSTQSSPFRSSGSTAGNGKRDADIVT
jgi:hypothetical protein